MKGNLMNEIKNAAAYIRVSTHMQDELSPDAQKRLLADYAKANNLILSNEHIFIEKGISGKKADNRPEFMRMISMAKHKPTPFNVILVWKFSRFARNQEESIVYKSLLRKQCNIDVVSISEPILDGPFGSLIERIIEWMDEYYSIRLSGEVSRGMTERALRGGYLARPPLGYKITVPKQPPVIVSEEAEIVKLIFNQFVYEHKSAFEIARYLNALGYKTSHNGKFERRGIQYILENPTYCGMVRWNQRHNETKTLKDRSEWIVTEGKHEAIISKELFEEAQKRLAEKPHKARPVCEYKHWLSGLMHCPYCGRSMVYHQRIVKDKYVIGSFQCYGYCKGICSKSSSISSKKLEPVVFEALQNAIQNSNLDFEIEKTPSQSETTIAVYYKMLEKIAEKEKRIKAAYREGIDTLEEYKANKQILLKEKEKILNEIKQYKSEVSNRTELQDTVVKRIRNAYDVITSDQFTLQQKNEALRSVVKKIVYNRDTDTLNVYYYYRSPAE